MTPLDVISMIRQAGGRVVVLDGDLQIVTPPGTVSAEAAAVLRENKTALIGILSDAERQAIQWVESLDQAEAAVVVDQARREWTQIVGDEPVVVRAEIFGDALVLVCPTPEIRDKIEAGRPIVEKILAETGAELHAADEVVEEIERIDPCQQCGSLEQWQSLAGSWRCLKCDPPIKAEWWAAKVSRLRGPHPLTIAGPSGATFRRTLSGSLRHFDNLSIQTDTKQQEPHNGPRGGADPTRNVSPDG
jgi:hypothetical protein